MLLTSSIAALVAWLTIACLPWQPHRTRERVVLSKKSVDLRDVSVLIPARNEADTIERVLNALLSQGSNLHIQVIDDQSNDTTAEIVARVAARLTEPGNDTRDSKVELISGHPLPKNWSGKLWALEQGLAGVKREYTLLLDADIELRPYCLSTLLAETKTKDLALNSVMATLNTTSVWEKLLVPAFVFFFKLLYPFALVARQKSRVAAAAGGCILLQTDALRRVGGFSAWSNALIDDCTLARFIKDAGYRIQLGLSHAVVSLREYDGFSDFSAMVTRTAFTQLRYLTLLLGAITCLMIVLFLMPVVAICAAIPNDVMLLICAFFALVVMIGVYMPIVRYYALNPLWAISLPLIATLFLAMTWKSAVNYWLGTRANWKSRDYETS